MDISEKNVLCGANSYVEKYYFNQEHKVLPESVQKELQAMCVLFTEEVGGILTVGFNDDGSIELVPDHEAADYYYDEIEAQLKVRALMAKHEELFGQLTQYYNMIVKKK